MRLPLSCREGHIPLARRHDVLPKIAEAQDWPLGVRYSACDGAGCRLVSAGAKALPASIGAPNERSSQAALMRARRCGTGRHVALPENRRERTYLSATDAWNGAKHGRFLGHQASWHGRSP